MKTNYFKIPHNKHFGKKPKDWRVPKYNKEKNMESIIKWQKGEPKKRGLYIITTNEGEIGIVTFHIGYSPDIEFFKFRVKAWCKLSDIEPYREKEEI